MRMENIMPRQMPMMTAIGPTGKMPAKKPHGSLLRIGSRDNSPPPLVAGEVDLTDFDFMPLDVRRLLQSQFWIKSMMTDPRLAAVSVNLWAVSWHQIPASSLPNEDAVLARFAMVDLLTWLEIRDAVLEPWVLCDDNRWYHPVVAEKAESSWAKMRGREAKAAAFSKRQSDRAKQGWYAGRNAGRNANIMDKDKEGESEDENLPSSNELSGSAGHKATLPRRKKRTYPVEFEEWWARYPVKKGKEHAYPAFETAKQMIGIDGLHTGLDRYFKYRKENNLDRTPDPWPATWLINRRWEDGT